MGAVHSEGDSMKKSFVFHSMWGDLISSLPDEQAGRLIKMLCCYVFDGDDPETNDPSLRAMFNMIKVKLDQDAEAYEEVINKRSQAGKKGASKRWGEKQTIANDSKCHQMITNDGKAWQTMGDTVTDTVTDTDKDNKTPISPLGSPGAYFPNDPELDKAFSDFVEYRRNNNKPVDIDHLKRKLWDEGKGNRNDMIHLLDESMAQGWTGIYSTSGRASPKKKRKGFDGERTTDYSALEEELLGKKVT